MYIIISTVIKSNFELSDSHLTKYEQFYKIQLGGWPPYGILLLLGYYYYYYYYYYIFYSGLAVTFVTLVTLILF